MTSVMLFMMSKELYESIKESGKTIADVADKVSDLPTGPIRAIVYAVIIAALQVAYTTLIIIAVLDMGKSMLNTLHPPIRKHKILKLRTAMDKICGFLGFTFDCDLDDLDNYKYLPSNPQLDEDKLLDFLNTNKGTQTGLPRVTDFGYTASQFFEFVRVLTNGSFALKDNVVYLRNIHSDFWIKQSTWVKPEMLDVEKRNNGKDIIPTRVFAFRTDLNNHWSVDNTTGYYYQVNVDAPSIPVGQKLLEGEPPEVNFNIGLATRKNNLDALELALQGVAKNIDTLINTFGGNSNLEDKIINNRTGIALQSDNWHSVPMLVYEVNEKLPTNYRDLLSAKAIYNKHYALDSFATGNGQGIIYKETIPFGLNDAVELINNAYFWNNGNKAKILDWDWSLEDDRASIEYIEEVRYTESLTETTLEE
jgi:hypothetical protein